MIFVSSVCSEKKFIGAAVDELARFGFKNIELSGGTKLYDNYLEDLHSLKKTHNLRYRVHNYFPPPDNPFVLNLASDDYEVVAQSKLLIQKAIDCSVQFESKEYGLHAGFRISPHHSELGQRIRNKNLVPYGIALKKFEAKFREMQAYAQKQGVELFLENNVFSEANFQSFDGYNPFFLTTSEDYFQMQEQFSFSLLLDVAHLKVSCMTLKKDFDQELRLLLEKSQYIHVSDNNGRSDSNHEFFSDSLFYQTLKNTNLANKTFTIEVYDGLESVRRCQQLLENLL